MAGTAVFRIVVSSDSMKNATATSHGRRRLLAERTGRRGERGALGGWNGAHRLIFIHSTSGSLRPVPDALPSPCAGTFPSLFIG